jgi:hypothetical protein
MYIYSEREAEIARRAARSEKCRADENLTDVSLLLWATAFPFPRAGLETCLLTEVDKKHFSLASVCIYPALSVLSV